MLRKLAIFFVVLIAFSYAEKQDSVEVRPYEFDDMQDFIPFYMNKKSLSEKMKSVKGRVANNLMRDTLFG